MKIREGLECLDYTNDISNINDSFINKPDKTVFDIVIEGKY